MIWHLLLDLWPFAVGFVLFAAGFFTCCLLAARSNSELASECDDLRRRLQLAEERQALAIANSGHLAPVVPFTYQPSMAQQRHGLKVVEGGRR